MQRLAVARLDRAEILARRPPRRRGRSPGPRAPAAHGRESGRTPHRPGSRRLGPRTAGTSPITWSMRRPPPLTIAARRISASGRYPVSRSRFGIQGGRPHRWPSGSNSSGGAPMLNPGASRSCHSQASAPPGSTPIGEVLDQPGPGPARGIELLGDEELQPARGSRPGRGARPPPARPPDRQGASARRAMSASWPRAARRGRRTAPIPRGLLPARCARRRGAAGQTGRRSAQRSSSACALPPPALVAVDDGVGEQPARARVASAATAALRPPGASSTRRRRGLRHRRLEGKYGLRRDRARSASVHAADSGPGTPPPSSCNHVARLRTSARSPMPQLSPRPGGGHLDDHAPGAEVVREVAPARSDEQRRHGTAIEGREVVEPEGKVGGQAVDGAEVRSVLQRQVTAAVQHLGRSGSHDPQGPASAVGSPRSDRMASMLSAEAGCHRPAVSTHPSSMPHASVATTDQPSGPLPTRSSTNACRAAGVDALAATA